MEGESKKTARSDLDEAALYFHKYPRPGKLEIQATKPLGNQRDLALAYSPGVAAPCLEIRDDPATAADYTARANLVGVVSNGSAVLGLGNIGPLASKPVMEGKAVLFKKFAGIDVFDIEIDAPGIERMVETISALEPTFGGINLEDIKAPECFEVEEQLKARMGIPVFHDDQHGTAIIVAAAVLNGLEFAGKTISDIKIVTSGAGAAALACLNLLVSLGARVENIWVTDRFGVAYKGRVDEMDRWKDPYVKDTEARTLADVISGRRRVPRPVGRRRAEAGTAPAHGAEAADPGAGQPQSRDHAGSGARRAARRDDLHRPFRFSQSGQQRTVLSLHLSRRARLRRQRHQRRDEDGGGAGDRRPCPRRAVRCRRPRLFRRDADLRAGLPDPLALRSAPDPAHRAGRRQGRLRHRRRDTADHRLRRLYRQAQPLRLPLRPGDEAGVLVRQGVERQARHLCRRRGRARAARRPGGAGGRHRRADPDRPPACHRGAAEALRAAHQAGRRFRPDQSRRTIRAIATMSTF